MSNADFFEFLMILNKVESHPTPIPFTDTLRHGCTPNGKKPTVNKVCKYIIKPPKISTFPPVKYKFMGVIHASALL